MILYFKKYRDTQNGTDWNYNNSCLSIDENFANLEVSIPGRKINKYSIYGQGQVVIPTYFFDNREVKFTFRNKAKNNTIFHNEKDNFFINWLYTNDEVFLIRRTEKGLQKIKGIFSLDANEKYRSYSISNDLTVSFITEDSFFESVNKSQLVVNIDYVPYTFQVYNAGMFTSYEVYFTNNSYLNMFEIKNNLKYFRMSELNTLENSTLHIDFKKFKFTINNNLVFPKFTGESFFLESNINNITINSDSKGSLIFEWTERFI